MTRLWPASPIAVKPDFFQLHGQESPARAAAILARFGIPLIKALPLGRAGRSGAQQTTMTWPTCCCSTRRRRTMRARPGGHGAAFDWQMLKGAGVNKPWFLAGGLNPENVARAIAVSGAPMVDVSSGVESAPGVKSESLIADFVAAARQQVAA